MTIAAWETILDEEVADQAWLDTVALLALDVVTGSATEGELKRLRARLANAAMRNRPEGSSDSARDQLRLLVVQLDAAIGRRESLKHLEPTGWNARVIDRLRALGGSAFNEDLRRATDLQQSHLSRACSELQKAGMLLRRKIGRQVEWTLTPLADAVKVAPEIPQRPDTGQAPGKESMPKLDYVIERQKAARAASQATAEKRPAKAAGRTRDKRGKLVGKKGGRAVVQTGDRVHVKRVRVKLGS